MAKKPKFYWDSCAWLGLLNGEADKKRELGIIYAEAKRDRSEIWTSALSLVEVHRFDSEKNQAKPLSDANLKKLADIFEQPFVKIVAVDLQIARHARELVRTTPNLTKRPDAIHLASALRWNVDALHTYDRDDLLHLDGQFTCRDGRKLVICYPDQQTDGTLFAHGKAKKS